MAMQMAAEAALAVAGLAAATAVAVTAAVMVVAAHTVPSRPPSRTIFLPETDSCGPSAPLQARPRHTRASQQKRTAPHETPAPP